MLIHHQAELEDIHIPAHLEHHLTPTQPQLLTMARHRVIITQRPEAEITHTQRHRDITTHRQASEHHMVIQHQAATITQRQLLEPMEHLPAVMAHQHTLTQRQAVTITQRQATQRQATATLIPPRLLTVRRLTVTVRRPMAHRNIQHHLMELLMARRATELQTLMRAHTRLRCKASKPSDPYLITSSDSSSKLV